jgi:predicted phage terminase large subunit-like protein
MPLFVNADREVIDDFKACISALGFETSESRRSTHWVVRIKGGEQVRAWLDSHGLAGASSYTKRIPARVMNGDKDAVANFIGAYWTCDGGFDVRPTRERLSRYRAYGTTVSEALAVDLVYALGLLGIESRLRRKARRLDTAAQPGGVYKSFSVEVQKEACTALFADLPGLCSRKKAIAANCQRTFERPLWDDPIVSITSAQDAPCMCLTVEEDSSFVCSGIAVKNTMKSLLSSVFWPAWEWGPLGRPQTRIIGASYELQGLATRDARKMRLLVQSDWFQKRWPIAFAADQDAKMRFENRATGWRAAKAITSLTGERGDRLIIDDPHSIKTAESDANRAEALMNFREAAPSRLVDQAKSAIIVIMQRVHQEDIAGYIIEHEPHYQKLILPMEFEADRRCVTSIGFEDPREEEGELLFPARFSREVVDRDKRTMGEYAVAGQFQQRPSPRQGGLFKADRIKIVDAIPDGVRDWVRAWDLAGTEGAGAWTAGVLMGRHKDGYIIADVDRFQLSPGAVQNRIKEVAKLDGKRIPIRIPQDPGQAGKGQVQDYAKALDGFILKAVPPTGDKETRALPLAVQVENERVQMLRGEWNDAFLAEMRLFPAGRYKDQIDAAADAYAELVALPSTPTLAAPLGATRQSAFYGQAG